MKTLYVRIVATAALSRFFRCGIEFGKDWKAVSDLDDATAQRLEEEQMLEVTETRPAALDEVAAGDSAGTLQHADASVTPAAAPTAAELALAEKLAALEKLYAGLLEKAQAEQRPAEAPPAEPAAAEPATGEPASTEKATAKPTKKAAK